MEEQVAKVQPKKTKEVPETTTELINLDVAEKAIRASFFNVSTPFIYRDRSSRTAEYFELSVGLINNGVKGNAKAVVLWPEGQDGG